MLVPRQIQLAQAPPLRAFHLWSKMAPGLALLASDDLKVWAQRLLQRLATSYAVKVQAFALEADEIHLVLQWTPEAAAGWSDAEAERRWLLAHPPQVWGAAKAQAAVGGLIGAPAPGPMGGVPMGEAGMQARSARVPAVDAVRRKLGSLSMFMKQFKQMLAQKINRENKRRGGIWRGRFHLSALADSSQVAGAMAFVDLRAVVGHGGTRPEEQPFTSLHARVAIYKGQFGTPPLGPLSEPGGEMQPLPAEVVAELREAQDPWAPGAAPPPETGMPAIPGMAPGAPPTMPAMDLPPGMPMPPPMDGMGGMPMNPMPPMPGPMPAFPPAPVPMGADPTGGSWSAKADPPSRAFWLRALREDSPVPGVDAPAGSVSPDILGWLSLRKYLALLDGLVAQAKAWPRLPAHAPGRAKGPETPAWGGAVQSALAALGLDAAGFAGVWGRMAKARG